MIRWLKKLRDRRLEKRVAELESELDAERRKLAVAEAEIESMAAVNGSRPRQPHTHADRPKPKD